MRLQRMRILGILCLLLTLNGCSSLLFYPEPGLPFTPEKAHRLLHTTYANRNRIAQDDIILTSPGENKRLSLKICFGTSCFLRGAQNLYTNLMEHIRGQGLADATEFTASFCGKACKKGPVLEINGKVIEHCTMDIAVREINEVLGG